MPLNRGDVASWGGTARQRGHRHTYLRLRVVEGNGKGCRDVNTTYLKEEEEADWWSFGFRCSEGRRFDADVDRDA